MHRAVPAPGEVRRPCVFCDETVLQVHGRLATNQVTRKTGMAHEHCWANDKIRQSNGKVGEMGSAISVSEGNSI